MIIHLKSAYSPLTAQFADRAGMIMSPTQLQKLGDKFATDPVCVGPFMYQNRVAGDSITVVKSPYYYNKKDSPSLQDRVQGRERHGRRGSGTKAGDLQALDAVDSTQLAGIRADKSLRVQTVTGLGYQGLTLNIGNKNGLLKPYSNVGTPIASNNDLRTAFEMAINRKEMAKVVFNNTVLPGCTPLSPSSAWFDKTVKCTPYNPTQAKKLVAASGISNPTVNLMVPVGTAAARQAQFMQAEEAAVGIHVVIDTTDFVTSLSRPTPAPTTRSRSAGRAASIRTATSTSSSRRRARRTTAGTRTRGST